MGVSKNSSVAKAFQILETFTPATPQQGVTEISVKTKLDKATVFRFLKSLEALGVIYQNPTTGLYQLGAKLYELGHRVPVRSAIVQQMHPLLQQLVEKINITVHLATLSNGEVLYIDKIQSRKTLQMNTYIGARNPVHCTALGKSMIAFLSEEELNKILQYFPLRKLTPNSITDVGQLKAELARIRQNGYAVDDEEFEEGLRCVAVPVLGTDQKPLVAISISGPLSQISDKTIPKQVSILKETAQKLDRIVQEYELTLKDFLR